jgi:hypothetical protein
MPQDRESARARVAKTMDRLRMVVPFEIGRDIALSIRKAIN